MSTDREHALTQPVLPPVGFHGCSRHGHPTAALGGFRTFGGNGRESKLKNSGQSNNEDESRWVARGVAKCLGEQQRAIHHPN